MTTRVVGVVPFVHKPYYEALKATLELPELSVMFIDNTQENLGVAGSWNRGIKFMEDTGSDWLIIMSAAMRFGHKGGLDMLEQIENHPSADIIRFAEKTISEQRFDKRNKADNPSWEAGAFYWHCTAISSEVVKQVGKFDENFYPIYFEDTDYDLRIKKAGFAISDIIAPIDARSQSIGHAAKLENIKSDSSPAIAYFATKWGRHPSAAELGEYARPFNNPENSLAFWPPARGQVWDA